MTRGEAVKIIKENMHLSYDDGKIFEALKTLVPELAENEDERIRKLVVNRVRTATEMTESLRELLLTYLEKQKDVSKAIEAVDRIYKYIEVENVANAHDMNDSNPNKKYYCGWNDALGKVAGILQDVYSEDQYSLDNKYMIP